MDSTKLCECGCGQQTPLGKWTDKRRGLVKGQPTRFCIGHNTQPKAGHIGPRYVQLPCACHCGKLAPLHRSGWPQQWVSGHQNRNRFHGSPWLHKRLYFVIRDCGYETPCYVWQGSADNAGYPSFTRNRRKYAVHRQVIMTFAEGPLPEGWEACHRCDNPPCIRPDHLFAGTRADNVHDMISKRRDYQGERPWIFRPKPSIRGEQHYLARLTREDVWAIRAAHEAGNMSERKLAAAYGVSRGAISRILDRSSWDWLED